MAAAAAEAAAEAAQAAVFAKHGSSQAAVFAAPLPAAALALIGREAAKVQEAARAAAELKVGLQAATEASEATEAMEAMAAPRAPQQLREYVASEDETVRQIATDCDGLRLIATDCLACRCARLRRRVASTPWCWSTSTRLSFPTCARALSSIRTRSCSYR